MSQLVLSIKNWGRGKKRLETSPPVVNVPIHPSMDFTLFWHLARETLDSDGRGSGSEAWRFRLRRSLCMLPLNS